MEWITIPLLKQLMYAVFGRNSQQYDYRGVFLSSNAMIVN